MSADLEQQIRAAYRDLATYPLEWVLLTRIRPKIRAPKEDVDVVLRRMERQPDVHLVPEANQRTLTRADWDAAVRIGDVPKHLIAIEPR